MLSCKSFKSALFTGAPRPACCSETMWLSITAAASASPSSSSAVARAARRAARAASTSSCSAASCCSLAVVSYFPFPPFFWGPLAIIRFSEELANLQKDLLANLFTIRHPASGHPISMSDAPPPPGSLPGAASLVEQLDKRLLVRAPSLSCLFVRLWRSHQPACSPDCAA